MRSRASVSVFMFKVALIMGARVSSNLTVIFI